MKENEKMRIRRERGGGFVLVTSLLLLSTLSLFWLALSSRSNIFLQAAERNQNRIVAFNMAEAGLDWAIRELETDSSFRDQTAAQNVTGSYQTMDTNYFQGGYGVSVGPALGSAGTRAVTLAGHAPANGNLASPHQCPGSGNLPNLRAYQCRSITAFVQVGPPTPFDAAVFTRDTFEMNNGTIDSYDSRLGGYSAQTAGSKAEIRTNSTFPSTVTLRGNAALRGNAVVGPGGDPRFVISLGPRAQITGTQSAATAPQNFPSVQTPSGAQFRDLSRITTSYRLPAGTYRTDSLKISGQGQLIPTNSEGSDKVIIYVSESVDISGQGVATIRNLPPNFLVYVTGDDSVKVGGSGHFYGGVYAPQSEVEGKGNIDFFGALIAKDYKQTGGGSLHFDEAMKNSGVEGAGDYEGTLNSWREPNTLA